VQKPGRDITQKSDQQAIPQRADETAKSSHDLGLAG
jgi:hypothetical protein